MKRILAFAGGKQSGKNTCCNFLHGHQLMCYKIIDDFAITEDGQLYVESKAVDGEGNEHATEGVVDVARQDLEFGEWAAFNMWPFVKHYAFAAMLKEIANGLFGLTSEQAYGTDKQKNSLTTLKWQDMPGITTDPKEKSPHLTYHERGRMTAREFLQYFGSDICRKIYQPIWTRRTLNEIETEEPQLAIISDCRFPNEIDAIHDSGGKVIHLTRRPYEDSHVSENALSGWTDYDAVIDNAKMTVPQANSKIIDILRGWGWLGEAVPPYDSKASAEQNGPTLVGGIHKIKE
tara:strand:- start:1524 stop:2393 length:870 start_codon:yes stop_codon:yes gene_type:complete